MPPPTQAQATTPVTAIQQRLKRERIYRQKMPAVNLMLGKNGQVLHPAPKGIRSSNFLKFVELYFTGVDDPNNRDPFSDTYQRSTKMKKGANGYKAFRRFADTDYGSYVIKEMLDNKNKYKKFKIKEAFGPGAVANYDTILLPKTFPTRKKFNGIFGQDVYDLAIIYHEFSHTMVFRSTASKEKKIDIFDERLAVINFENPVRMLMGYEPRYTYTIRGQAQTINIITKITGDGILLVDKNDPTKLVSPTSKDALR